MTTAIPFLALLAFAAFLAYVNRPSRPPPDAPENDAELAARIAARRKALRNRPPDAA